MATGDDRTAGDMLAAHRDRPQTTRRRLLGAWLHLRAGRLADARAELAAAGSAPIMRRDAVLAAAITVGLARRATDEEALRATWYRVAPVIAGAEVEPLLLDVWGELSVGAALVSPVERDTIVAAMDAALTRAGAPAWASAVHAWWALQRAVATNDVAAAAAVHVGDWFPVRAEAARVWASMLSGVIDAQRVRVAAQALADAGQPWEGAALCGAAATRLTDTDARDLLAAGRALRATMAAAGPTATGGLSTRERSVGELLLDGLTHKEIGARLYISPKTVEQHVARLRQKLLAANRAELVAALRAKLSG
jgi:DNA-binding CsgD family transcriptional regulator